MLHIKAGVASMAGAWFIHWPVRGLYGLRVRGKGYVAECGLRNAERCQRVICGKFDADFFCGMKGKVWNESMRNVTE